MRVPHAVFFLLAVLVLVAFSGCTSSTYYGVTYSYGTYWGRPHYKHHHHHHHRPPPSVKPRPPGKPGPPHRPKPPAGKPKPRPRR